jgi:hypothetical protein
MRRYGCQVDLPAAVARRFRIVGHQRRSTLRGYSFRSEDEQRDCGNANAPRKEALRPNGRYGFQGLGTLCTRVV